MSASRRVQGAGLSLFVTEAGDPGRPTILLVHGFPDTSAVWDPLVDRLTDFFHVVRYDVRGAGQSDVPPLRSEYALSFLVDDMAAVARATSPDSPVHLVGHDWGSVQGWEAVTTPELADSFASYTSISGPPLDHAGLWARRHRSLRPSDLFLSARQALHSWYIAFFHLPLLPELMERNPRATDAWAKALHRMGASPDGRWPAPTFGADFAHGVELYRANVRSRLLHPEARHTDVPVQLLVPLRDRYVTPALLDGLEDWSSHLWRRPVNAGHWVIRTDPDVVAAAVREMIASVERRDGPSVVDAHSTVR
ncbi:MAG TPA: alpha/beta fold hydrolase [Acidimicrobiales bacterium]